MCHPNNTHPDVLNIDMAALVARNDPLELLAAALAQREIDDARVKGRWHHFPTNVPPTPSRSQARMYSATMSFAGYQAKCVAADYQNQSSHNCFDTLAIGTHPGGFSRWLGGYDPLIVAFGRAP
jgi:hypothetical protein